jgi:hypothetical protein
MTADQEFDRIAAGLLGAGARAGAMFGKRALLVGSKAFACLKGDALAFRLGAGSPEHTTALGLPGAALFDPSGKGRPFKDWVAVPITEATRWSGLAEHALHAALG